MSTSFLHRFLAKNREDILSADSEELEKNPRLQLLKNAEFAFLFAKLTGGNKPSVVSGLSETVHDISSEHTFSEQVTTTDQLELTVFQFLREHSFGESLLDAPQVIAECFCEIRRIVTESYSASAAAGGQLPERSENGKEDKGTHKEFRRLHESVVDANSGLEQSMAKLIHSEKLSAMDKLIAGIAHELNNPLTGILGYIQLMLESESDSSRREKLDRVSQEALRCKKIIQNLLGFARREKPRKKMLNLNELIRNVIDLREYQIRADGVEIATHLADDQPCVVGDTHQLQQVILNTLNNAHQAILTEKTGTTIDITTLVDRKNNQAVILVSDDGPGIAADHLPKIFDPFFTTREVGHGTGLGLSVTYGIVQEHEGKIAVESSPGRRTTFHISLPLADTCADLKKTDRGQLGESVERHKYRRALIVDDEEIVLELLTDILLEMGLSVERARDGGEALQKIETEQFDFMISELKMPGMNGRTLYSKVKTLDPRLAKRIIFSTEDTMSDEFRAFHSETQCRFIEKPFLIEDVQTAIDALGTPQSQRG